MFLLLAAHPDGAVLQELTAEGLPSPRNPNPLIIPRTAAPGSATALPAVVRERENRRPRWIWQRTQDWYPALLEAGVELERC
ncbi:MAG: bifunctional 3-5 exonuclease/DNA polymerase [Arthrobacter sp.]|nr:bifunctional 3-5 exonuclease/DNA polymerase [Arthrobacter sp.]